MAFVIPTKYVGKTSYFHETFGDFTEKCVCASQPTVWKLRKFTLTLFDKNFEVTT